MKRLTVMAMAGAVAACSPGAQAPNSTPVGPAAPPQTEAVRLVATIDGDTIEVDTGATIERVRLIGINAPERDECHGDAARDALDRRLMGAAITLEAGDADDRDRFGRLLRYVAVDGVDVGAAHLDSGDAFVLQSDHPRRAAYVAAAGAAAGAERGLWRPDRCGAALGTPLVISDFDPNPPGPDDDPVAGEYVTVARLVDGSEPWSLEGWALRDESSVHRYVFPDVQIRPSEAYTIRTGCGTDAGFDLYWCAGGPVWSNGGDTILLLDPSGNVVTHVTYER